MLWRAAKRKKNAQDVFRMAYKGTSLLARGFRGNVGTVSEVAV